MANGAFAMLKGPGNFCDYITVLPTTLGRSKPGATPKSDFITMCTAKTCSRKHAIIDWDAEAKKFMLEVLGKNGVTVARRHYSKGAKVILKSQAPVLVGDRKFYFLVARAQSQRTAALQHRPSSVKKAAMSPNNTTKASAAAKNATSHASYDAKRGGHHERPNMSYVQLLEQIFRSLRATDELSLTVAQLRQRISHSYPYYSTMSQKGLNSSLRQSLNSRPYFVKTEVFENNTARKKVVFHLNAEVAATYEQPKRLSTDGYSSDTKRRRVACLDLSQETAIYAS